MTFFCLSAHAQESREPAHGGVPDIGAQAKDLEAHLLAPCCWRETLTVHQSQIASALRDELRKRLARGESAAHIEADLVARYGQRIYAQLPDRLGYIIALLSGGFGLFFLYVIAKSSSPAEPEPVPVWRKSHNGQARPEQQKYESMLDDDLDTDLV